MIPDGRVACGVDSLCRIAQVPHTEAQERQPTDGAGRCWDKWSVTSRAGGRWIFRAALLWGLVVFLTGCEQESPSLDVDPALLIELEGALRTAWLADGCSGVQSRLSGATMVPGDEKTCTVSTLPGDWTPTKAVLAQDGGFGFTSGVTPMGQYLHVWDRSGGGWRLSLVARVQIPVEGTPGSPFFLDAGYSRVKSSLYHKALRVAMLKADRDMARFALTFGHEAVLDTHLSVDGTWLDEWSDASSELGGQFAPEVTTWVPVRGRLAGSGDLGYTYGFRTIRSGVQDAVSTPYVRMWRAKADSTWEVVFNIDFAHETVPQPAESGADPSKPLGD